VVNLIDVDGSGSITDEEWNDFFGLFITPFMKCDADKDNLLTSAELFTCITT